MDLWVSNFETSRPMFTMPRLMRVVRERQTSASHRNVGRFRQVERHCLFEYTLVGEGAFRDAAGERRTPPGHGFLCEVGDPEIEYYHPGPEGAPWEFVLVCFDGPAATAMTRELSRRHGPVYQLDMESPAVRRLLAARRQGQAPMEICAGEGAGLVFELLAALDASKRRHDEPGGHAELVREAKRLLAASMPQGMPIGDLAVELGVSREHLSRVFAKETGSTPHEHLARLRLYHACRLLKEGGMGVKEIGYELGIESPQHFARLFKKSMRMTPTQFRQHGVVPSF